MTNQQPISPLTNPYKKMLLRFHPNRVYGWEREIVGIMQMVTADEPASQAIYGIRAIGKSTLLKYLKHPRGALQRYKDYIDRDYVQNRKQLLGVYMNFHNLVGGLHVLDVMYEHLRDELLAAGYSHYADLAPSSSGLPPRETALQIRQLLQELKQNDAVRVVFLMDDFDIPLLADQITQHDDHLLRTISDEASLVIATDEPISELNPDITKASPLLGILRPERIGLISLAAAQRLIREPAELEGGIHYLDEEVQMLLQVGGRIPYLLTVTCEKYYDMRGEIPDKAAVFSTPALYQKLRAQLIDQLLMEPHIRNVFDLIWSKRTYLHPVLHMMAEDEERGFSGHHATRAEMYSLAYPDGGLGSFRIFSALFAEFVRRQAEDTSAETLSPDTLLKQILNSLSPVDRGVLAYLSSRVGQVCTFDELKSAAWDDGTGTKRALEAAVHRLRRTVPEGHHIKNVRGAGYKYVITDSAKV
jgi:hypothetical protein